MNRIKLSVPLLSLALVFVVVVQVKYSLGEVSQAVAQESVAKQTTLTLEASMRNSLPWISINSGGSIIADTIDRGGVTFGQSMVGLWIEQHHQASLGFWPQTVDNCRPGDADGSRIIEISDAVYIVQYVFVPDSPPPTPYEVLSGDADCSCIVEISDAVYLVNWVFVPGSPAPCTCEEWLSICGPPLRYDY